MSAQPRRVLVLGAGGFLGSYVTQELLARRQDGLILHFRQAGRGPGSDKAVSVSADLTDPRRVTDLLSELKPNVVVNCVAFADVDACEVDSARADILNHQVPACLAHWTAKSGSKLVHVSTDAVFDGRGGPYGPETPPSPVNAYGKSKRDGELAVLSADAEALIVRTNFVGWSPAGDRSLLEYFYRRLSHGEAAPGYVDILFRPLPVHWFWPGCERFIAAGATGIIHLTGPELLSKFEFGRRVATSFGLDEGLIVPVDGFAQDLRALRPPLLDVVPSRLFGEYPIPGDLAKGLFELWQRRGNEGFNK